MVGTGEAASTSFPSNRQKIRKGTFSCWECKRRKRRCEFKPDSSSVCVLCQRRKLSCVGQEFEDNTGNSYSSVEKRITRVETLVDRLGGQRDSNPARSQFFQSARYGRTSSRNEAFQQIIPNSLDCNYRLPAFLGPRTPSPWSLLSDGQDFSDASSLSNNLRRMLPPASTTKMILECKDLLKMAQFPSTGKSSNVQSLNATPAVTPPIRLAHEFLQLALCLVQFDAMPSNQQPLHLKESALEMARKYVDIASRLVTSQEHLVGSLEGLEILMLEAVYHICIGNLRHAWLIFRRALGIGQLLGLPEQAESDVVWFHLICRERFLSLLLGLPVAATQDSFSLEVDDPLEKLERTQVVVVGRIITRNSRLQDNHQSEKYDSFQETQAIDSMLKRAAHALPITWWTTPSLHETGVIISKMIIFRTLMAQMHHFYLITVLHQPYFLSRCILDMSGSERASSWTASMYSKLTIIPACREVLSKFFAFCALRRIPSQPSVEEKAFAASITLLVAHLASHHLGSENYLEHQRSQDLGMIEEAIKLMDRKQHPDNSVFPNQHIELLKSLLGIEADASNGAIYALSVEKKEGDFPKEKYSITMPIPYLGAIHIKCQNLPTPQLNGTELLSIRNTGNEFMGPNTFGLHDRQFTSFDQLFPVPCLLDDVITGSEPLEYDLYTNSTQL